ncbi:hypothetical protein JCGZ_23959 [Jatropha curcas]|uniref:Uncharacterized protein n=1 Tax=Jatropha curcas TaxID=180498 RepID=A0A067JSH5_JATCU|nr:uncharacterized protein LOC105645515 [Jatropha curcas]KDP25738.1 hypothetical protein JCGZ_23959 [Jatropha curcas]
MYAKDWLLKPVQENNDFEDFDDENDETLSLSDLPLNNNSSSDYWVNDVANEDQESSSFDQEMFEFFSAKEDFSAASSPKDNIIFCGKLIPYKGEREQERSSCQNISDELKERKKSSIFSWKSFSLNRSKSTSALKIQQEQEKTYRTCKTFPEASSEKKHDFPVKKVPALFSSPSKSRWYLLAFGIGRYPMEMELNDIKTRQNKLSDSKMRRSVRSPATMFQSDYVKELVERSGKRKRGWWGFIRGFGCKE